MAIKRMDERDVEQFSREMVLQHLQNELDRTRSVLNDPETAPSQRRFQQVRRELFLKMAAAVPEVGELRIEPLPELRPALRELLQRAEALDDVDIEFVICFVDKMAEASQRVH